MLHATVIIMTRFSVRRFQPTFQKMERRLIKLPAFLCVCVRMRVCMCLFVCLCICLYVLTNNF
jgi:hypothetical protein